MGIQVVPEAWQFLVLAYQQEPAEDQQALVLIAQPKQEKKTCPILN